MKRRKSASVHPYNEYDCFNELFHNSFVIKFFATAVNEWLGPGRVRIAVENFDCEALYDKGYITFTTHQSRAGYFVMDVPLACAVSDDYHYLTHRRTINEAFRFAYDALLDFLMDEVPANNDGTIQAVYAKTVESAVERKISTNMGTDLNKNAEDPKDTGVRCFVDPNQNIVATSKMNVVVGVRPFGTNRWINVNLGFELQNS